MVEKVYVERHDMKKKRFVWISIIALVLILALLIIYKFIYKSGVGAISKEDDVTATLLVYSSSEAIKGKPLASP